MSSLTGEVWTHAGASLFRIAIGFGSALVVAVLMGLASFLWRSARIAVADVVTVLNSTSVFVWIVISLIWFGLTNLAPIFATFMITLPVVAANVVEGVATVDRRLLEMARYTGCQVGPSSGRSSSRRRFLTSWPA